MHMMGFTTWPHADVTAPDMRTWKFAGSRIYLSFPADAARETILAYVADALAEIDLESCNLAEQSDSVGSEPSAYCVHGERWNDSDPCPEPTPRIENAMKNPTYEVQIDQDPDGTYAMTLTIGTVESYRTSRTRLNATTREEARAEATEQVRALKAVLDS